MNGNHGDLSHEILYTCRGYVSVARRRIEEHVPRYHTRAGGTRASEAVVPGTGVLARVLFFSFRLQSFRKKTKNARRHPS